MRRARSQPLLRSAVVALGASGGLVVGGSLLLDATPAWAQPVTALHTGRSVHPPHPGAVRSSGPVAQAGATVPGRTAGQAKGAGAAKSTGAAKTSGHPHADAVPGSGGAATPAGSQLTSSGPVPYAVSTTGTSGTGGGAVTTTDNGITTTTNGNGNGNKVPKQAETVSAGAPAPGPGSSSKPASRSKGQSPSAGNAKGATVPAGPGSPPVPPAGPAWPAAGLVPPRVIGRSPRSFVLPLPSLTPLAAGPSTVGLLPTVGLPAASIRRFAGQMLRVPDSMLPEGWVHDSAKAADKLKLPISLLIAMAVFMLIQSLVDRRDPKVSDAPERPGEDSVGFE